MLVAEIIAIQVKGPKGTPMRPREEAEAIVGRGLRGNRGGRPGGKRQVLVMAVELIEKFDLEVGQVREQITTRGLDVMGLRKGDRLHIGDVILEATVECEPCEQIEAIRSGLQEAMEHQRGMLFRVIEGGMVHVGDRVEVVEKVPAE
jgi:MOSC domain-containing protein YiiM